HLSLLRAALYGGGAALGGCILYAIFTLVTGFEFALMAILVGYMVGKAIRHGSNGLGGRPQQILAVVLTYLAITTRYSPLFISQTIKRDKAATAQTAQTGAGNAKKDEATGDKPKMSLGGAIVMLILIAAAAPFLSLGSGLSGFLSLLIIFIGLSKAWK